MTNHHRVPGLAGRVSATWRGTLRGVAALLTGLVLLVPAAQAQPSERALQAIDAVALDGDRLLLTLTLSAPAPEPVVFTVEQPARLSLDLPDTRLAVAERYKRLNIGAARAVAAAEAEGRTRVVLELSQLTTHAVRIDGNRVLLTLDGPAGAGPASAPPTAAAPQAQPAISAVDFRRGDKGEGRVVVTLTDPATPVDVSQRDGKIVARFKSAGVSDALIRRLDVLDFATPVKFIDTSRVGINAEIAVTPATGGEFEQLAYQSGNLFIIELQPLTREKLEERRLSDPEYTGEKISLSFQKVDIRSLLQIIADVAGTNMVVSDAVTGDIAIRLQSVPWDQALDIILRTKGLGMRQQGNVMLVAPLTELAERDKIEREAQKQRTELAPLRTELIQVNYAKASEIAALLKSGDNAILSERGRVNVDERTNNLLLLETRETIAAVRALVARLDIPVKQVLIESRIVIANNDFSRELGARFGVSHVNSLNNTAVGVAGNIQGARTAQGGVAPAPAAGGLNFSLPASSNAGSLGLALLGSDYAIDLELSALQAEGRGEVISSPRVLTANAKQASIEQGVEIPYSTSSGNQGTNVQFKKAVLSLSVKPQVTPDNRVIMDLEVKQDTVGDILPTADGGSAPAINTRQVHTQALVDNGATVVLGGIFIHENRNDVTKVPFLGDIPILGAAFRNRLTVANKDELLIFVTPKILQEGLVTR